MADVKIAPASGKSYNHHYNPITVASLDFGEFLVSRIIECEKSDDWKTCEGDGFLRLAALDFPAYGRSFIKSAAFFVPYYQILQNIDGFQANMVADNGIPCIMPSVRADLCNVLLGNTTFATLVGNNANPSVVPTSKFHFMSISDAGGDITNFNYWLLNNKGKHIYKWLKSLGFDFVSYNSSTSYSANFADMPTVNALNILAFCKIWCDYFCNIHLYQSNIVVAFLRKVKDGDDFIVSGNTWYDSSTGLISTTCIQQLYLQIMVPFESSLYLNAWNSENSPIGDISNQKPLTQIGLVSPVNPTISNPNAITTRSRQAIDQSVESVFLYDFPVSGTGSALQTFSALGQNSLWALYEFVRRNNLFGSEAAKQAFARFGIKGDDYNSLFARKLFEASEEIDYSAVMSNSNTVNGSNGSVLGAYAGIGLSALKFNYTYKVTDYGVILNLSWIQIVPMQMHGFDPSVLRIYPFDWWKPEWDGKGIRAIPNMEISTCKIPISNANNKNQSVYGFIGLYDDYRHMRDQVLGDFVTDDNVSKYLFARDVSLKRDNYTGPIKPQTNGMQYFAQYGDDPELTNPFQFTAANGDRFYLQIKWKFDAVREIKSDSDSLDLNGEGDIQATTNSNPNA